MPFPALAALLGRVAAGVSSMLVGTGGAAAGSAASATTGASAGMGFAAGQAVISLGVACAKSALSVRKNAQALVEARRGLAMFNGQLAASYAQLNVERMMRQKALANDVAGSTKGLVEATNEMEEAFLPLTKIATTTGNVFRWAGAKIATFVADLTTSAADALGVTGFFKQIEEWFDNNKGERSPIGEGWGRYAWGGWGGERPTKTGQGWFSNATAGTPTWGTVYPENGDPPHPPFSREP